MIIKKLKNYIFNPDNKETVQIVFGILLSFALTSIIFISKKDAPKPVPKELEQNLSLLIPKNHVLFPFNATNFENIEPLLSAYNLVKVYESEKGRLVAENIKVLRAPKDPNHLAFLIPVKIANSFMDYGINFRLVLQKYTNKKPLLIGKPEVKSIKKRSLTYGN